MFFSLPSQEVATWITSFWAVLARNASSTFGMNGQGKTEIELEYRSSEGAGISLFRGSYEEGSWVLMGLRRARKCRDLPSDFTNLSCLDRSLGMVNTGMIEMEHME
jgi:hypothetical protein